MGALAKPEVGEYLNEHFATAYQKVGTFKIVNGHKQGGNVASYFCTPDGSVIHAVPGPVGAQKFLREARWAVETYQRAAERSAGDEGHYRAFFKQAHGERLQADYGIELGYDVPNRTGSGPRTTLVHLDRWGLPRIAREGQVHWVLYQQPLARLDSVCPVVWENVLHEKFSTQPVMLEAPKSHGSASW